MVRYKEFDHTADIGVEIYGATLTELFQNAGYALFDTMVDAGTIRPRVIRTVAVSGNDLEMLLINWLRELLYQGTVEQEVYTVFEVQTLEAPQPPEAMTYMCRAAVTGETLDPVRHRFRAEIKAVTYHQCEVVHHDEGWVARVLFDV